MARDHDKSIREFRRRTVAGEKSAQQMEDGVGPYRRTARGGDKKHRALMVARIRLEAAVANVAACMLDAITGKEERAAKRAKRA